MDWYAKAFIKASVAWLAFAVSLGVAMAFHPPWLVYRPAHLHMALLGFVAMMIFGVAYHVIPRFAGNALRSRALATIHWWLANLGLLGIVVGFFARPHVGTAATGILGVGGISAAAGAYAFAYNLWRTMDSAPEPEPGVVQVRRGATPLSAPAPPGAAAPYRS